MKRNIVVCGFLMTILLVIYFACYGQRAINLSPKYSYDRVEAEIDCVKNSVDSASVYTGTRRCNINDMNMHVDFTLTVMWSTEHSSLLFNIDISPYRYGKPFAFEQTGYMVNIHTERDKLIVVHPATPRFSGTKNMTLGKETLRFFYYVDKIQITGNNGIEFEWGFTGIALNNKMSAHILKY